MKNSKRVTFIRPALLVCVTAIGLLVPSFYNGYPFLFYDSEMYVHYVSTTIRPPFYSLSLYPMHLNWSLWLVAFWQSIIISHLLYSTARHTFIELHEFRYLLVMILLTFFSILPWLTGFVMADLYTAVFILSMYLLTFCANGLGKGERFYLYFISTIAILVHSSNVPFAIIWLTAVGLLKFFGRKSNWISINSAAKLSIPLWIGLCIILANNTLMHKSFSLSPSGYAFILARLMEDGPGAAYLEESCGKQRYAMCDYKEHFPMTSEQFLWAEASPFRRLGWFDGYRREGKEIIWGTIKRYPLWTVQSIVKNCCSQLIFLDIRKTYLPLTDFKLLRDAIQDHFPDEFDAFLNSKQSRWLLPFAHILSAQKLAILFGILLTVIATARSLANKDWRPVFLSFSLVISILVSSALAGALSIPDPRYLNRTVWLILYFGLLANFAIVRNESRVTNPT